MMSKCDKNRKVAHNAIADCVTDILATFWHLLSKRYSFSCSKYFNRKMIQVYQITTSGSSGPNNFSLMFLCMDCNTIWLTECVCICELQGLSYFLSCLFVILLTFSHNCNHSLWEKLIFYQGVLHVMMRLCILITCLLDPLQQGVKRS